MNAMSNYKYFNKVNGNSLRSIDYNNCVVLLILLMHSIARLHLFFAQFQSTCLVYQDQFWFHFFLFFILVLCSKDLQRA